MWCSVSRAAALNLLGTWNLLKNFNIAPAVLPAESPLSGTGEAGPGPLRVGSIVPPPLATSAVGSSAQILDIWGQKLPRWPVSSPFPEQKVVGRSRTRSLCCVWRQEAQALLQGPRGREAVALGVSALLEGTP